MMKSKWFLMSILLVAVAVVAEQQPAQPPLQIAVYPFHGIGVEETAALSITNAVYRELLNSPNLAVRDQQSTRAAIEQIGLAQTGLCSEDKCKVEAGKILKAQKLIMGSVEKLDVNYYTISMRVVDVQTARTEYQAARDCPCTSNVQIRDMAIQLARETILVYLETGKKPQVAQPGPAAKPKKPGIFQRSPAPEPAPPTPVPPPAPTPPPTTAPSPAPARPAGGAPADMVFVPAGEFGMGCNEKVDNQCRADEKPYHKVYLNAFYIDKYEVTNDAYKKCVGAGICSANQKFKGFADSQQPVVGVDWNQASTYCSWAGKRLPTEAEWEKAARGTDGRTYPWGEGTDCAKANYGPCNQEKTKSVGSYPFGASPYGAMDMAGNVWEWVADWYDENYYQNSPNRNPTGPGSGQYRVLRGGSGGDPITLRASSRGRNNPGYMDLYVGLRCARTP